MPNLKSMRSRQSTKNPRIRLKSTRRLTEPPSAPTFFHDFLKSEAIASARSFVKSSMPGTASVLLLIEQVVASPGAFDKSCPDDMATCAERANCNVLGGFAGERCRQRRTRTRCTPVWLPTGILAAPDAIRYAKSADLRLNQASSSCWIPHSTDPAERAIGEPGRPAEPREKSMRPPNLRRAFFVSGTTAARVNRAC
jgi:hypothetical protein